MIQRNKKNAPGDETKPGARKYEPWTKAGNTYANENSTFRFLRQDTLTAAAFSGKVKVPKNTRGVAIAVSSLPRMKKVLPAVFAISALWRDQIGMAATSGIREDPAVSCGLGSVVSMPFSFNPKPHGGHHG